MIQSCIKDVAAVVLIVFGARGGVFCRGAGEFHRSFYRPDYPVTPTGATVLVAIISVGLFVAACTGFLRKR